MLGMKFFVRFPLILQLVTCSTLSPNSNYNSDESTDSSGEDKPHPHLYTHPVHPAGYGYHQIAPALFGYPHPSLNFGIHNPFFGHPFSLGGHYGGGHHGPIHGGPGGYADIPKQNCTVEERIQEAEFCVPGLQTVCRPVSVDIKIVIDQDQCQDISKTVCTEQIEEIENIICLITYEPRLVQAKTTTLEVAFGRKCLRQMLTVCQPAKDGYGHHDFSHNFCKEIAQDTCYNFPIVSTKEVDTEVTLAEPVEVCKNMPIFLPRIICQEVVTEQCVMLPEVVTSAENIEVCLIEVTPDCQTLNISLPHSRCIEIVYGFAHNLNKGYDNHEHKKDGDTEESEENRSDAESFVESTETVLSEELVIASPATTPTTTKQPPATTQQPDTTTKGATEATMVLTSTDDNMIVESVEMEPRITTEAPSSDSTDPTETTFISQPESRTMAPIIPKTMAPPTPVLTTPSTIPLLTTGIRVELDIELTTPGSEDGHNNIDDGLLDPTLPPLSLLGPG